ncbi:MAG: pyridoxal phosphate-dependent aminotransferase [Bacteroidales bacterium]|nr:pyridoxal phosphate-dependent aminotransferase [Bacteroidales bacterium]MCF8454968.1 pyridoxal phosphate-dependent aminotransferase [Bacteroidales bacterium]
MMKLAQRILNLSDSQTLEMAQKSRDLKAQGIDIKNLSIGEPDFNTPDLIKAAAKKAIDDNFSYYSPVPGFDDLRSAIVEKFRKENNLTYKKEQIVVSNGAKQSLANVLLSVIDKGDEVIIPAPYWVSYIDLVKLAEGVPVVINGFIESDFKVTPRQVQEAITDKTKAFLFNSPSNPTGSIYSYEELAALAEVFADKENILIISDEIYEHINFNGKHHSIAEFESVFDRVALVNGVSKGYAMTGWRIGYLAGPLWLAKATNKLQGQTTSGAGSISQKAALAALLSDNSSIEEMKSAFLKRRNLVMQLLDEIPGIVRNEPHGAFYIFPNISSFYGKSDGKRTIKNDSDLSMYLLEEAHVAVVPGNAFGNENCIRLSYACSEEELVEALSRMKIALGRLQ